MKSIQELFKYAKPYKMFVALAPILMAIEVLMDLIQPFVLQRIIDVGIANGDTDYVISRSLLMICAAFIGLIGGAGCTIVSSIAAIHFSTDVRKDLFTKISHFSSENRDAFGVGKLITIVTNDLTIVQNAFMMTLRVLVRGPLLFIGSIIIVYINARELFPILFVIIPILVFCIIILSRKAGKLFGHVQEAIDALNKKVQENLAGIRVIKAFVRKDYEINTFKTVNDQLTKKAINAEQVITVLMPIMILIINSATVFTLALGSFKVANDVIQVGVIISFINYLNIILMSLMTTSMVMMQLMRAIPSAERIQSIFNIKINIEQQGNAVAFNGIRQSIEFKNVSFSYSKNGENVLNSVSFKINKGEKIGIIGPTGSGKSTLIKLIPRVYDVDEGEILIDGINVKDYDLQTLRSAIGFTPQKSILFSGSIEENLRYGKDNATAVELETASRNAGALEFIEKLENRFSHKLAQQSTNLSGGQKQRLSISRAFVRKPSVLILDDSTSAVDASTERLIINALNKEYRNTTTFIIASKISSIVGCDQILVVDDGKLVGIGIHRDLLENCSLYQEIYETQGGEEWAVVE
ncbi:ABC transporter ATP-binding protein [Bacillus sp. Marseille-P3661]|uniref:ABC transporter ATP-binding protein n=1 Tax=Bacillus sp. Marseille-P3661 TaxID=1936234 RepID=UPI000C81B3C2|nr:ABC transporter ATP-binding protein [Bacillus sp. Marseille-P3661]